MSYVHDIGGMRARPIDVDDSIDFHDAWETRVFAMMRALLYNEVFNLDAFRHAVERMEPANYLGASYFQRWLDAIQRLCVEQGVLTQADVDRITASAEEP
jgi:nitrile hydratase